MSGTTPHTYPHAMPKPAWLAMHQEEILEPGLPIIDPHHHLWDHPGNAYLADEILADLASGQRIDAPVFVQCGWSYRPGGPEALRPLGETEAAVLTGLGGSLAALCRDLHRGLHRR